jgi:hypothetical protein
MTGLRARGAATLLSLLALGAGCAGPDPSPRANEPPPFPGSVGATAWRTAEDPPEGFGPGGDRFDSPHATLQALMAFGVQQEGGLPPGQRLVGDILDADAGTARAWLQLTGTEDDSVAGQEILLYMLKDGRGWFIDRLAFRDHCRRAVDPGGEQCV